MTGLTFYLKEDSFYSLQVHQKRPGCQTCNNSFLSLTGYTIPFLFTRDNSPNDVTSFTVKNTEDEVIKTLNNDLVKILNAGSIDYIFCNFNSLGETLECGLYYYELTMGNEVYYSEIFEVIGKDLTVETTDISVNGSFQDDLSGWTINGSVFWQSTSGGSALLQVGGIMSQTVPGQSISKIVVTTLATFTKEMYFSYGSWKISLNTGENTFYVPSGMIYTISNENDTDSNDLYVIAVEIYPIHKVECYNLIAYRNSCNKFSIPYVMSAYTNVFILDAELAEPEYLREDDFEEDGAKNKSQTFSRIQKRWSLKTSVAIFEPFVDELNKMPAHDTIYIFNDIWKKEFVSYQSTMDIEVLQAEWLNDDKCDALVTIQINETIMESNSCCEEISKMECCDSFNIDVEATPVGPEVVEYVVTIPEGNCPGLVYRLLTFDGDDVVNSEVFTEKIEFTFDDTTGLTYGISGSKFGCPDIIYTVLS